MKRILLLILLSAQAFITAEGILLARSDNFFSLEKEANAETADEAEMFRFRVTPGALKLKAHTFHTHRSPLADQAVVVSTAAHVLGVPFFILHGGLRT